MAMALSMSARSTYIWRRFRSDSNFAFRSILFQSRGMTSHSEPRFLTKHNGKAIAYRHLEGGQPGVVFFSGFQSNMQGTKAVSLETFCKERNLGYVRFDYEGCGESKGDLKEATFSDWRSNSLAVLDELTSGPQILVGSSMGAWMMLLAALARPERVHAMLGIASSVDFATWGMDRWPKEVIEKMNTDGAATVENDDYSYVLTKKFFDDARKHSLLERDEFAVTCPVRLLHGMKDISVPYHISLKIAEKIQTGDVEVLLRKGSDHRFSEPQDIQLICDTLDDLLRLKATGKL